MEFDEIVVKESPGLCRCCLSEGCYKDLSTEYTWMDDTEVYADMLLECFDISISQHNEGPNGPNRLICEVCITRLRDACNFKKQVLASEKKFVDMIGRGAFKPKVLLYQSPIKAEVNVAAPQHVEEADVEYLDDDIDFGNDELLKEEESAEQMSVTEDITVATLPIKGKRGRPRKNAAVSKSDKKVKVLKAEDKPRTSKAIAKGNTKQVPISMESRSTEVEEDKESDNYDNAVLPVQRQRGFSAIERRKIMRKNVTQVLLNSTLTPFRWLRKFYRCFFCLEVFKTPKEWRSHQSLHNITKDLHAAMKNYWESIVYVDVSNIACKLCSNEITDLNELIDHLVDRHGVKYNEEIRSMRGFKLDDTFVYCLLCNKKFYTFSHVLVHSNKDHKGGTEVLCDICGQHYRSLNYLRNHMRSEHSNGVKCTTCGISVRYTKLRTHMQKVHGKKYKCYNCPEIFETQYKRAHHTMIVHGDREMISCQYCSRTFVFKSTMIRHVKETHLRERNAECNICGWKSFGEHTLQRHMIKHSTVRDVKCPSCDKTFKTYKTMRQHCINIHQKA